MATYPIKMLKDEENKPFVPLVSTDCIRDENNQTLQQMLDKKMSPANLLAGDYVNITTEGNNCYINVDLPANLNIINNLTTESAGQGALDAYQGKILKDSIPQVINDLSSTSTTSALSANQGYILNNRINNLVIDNLESSSSSNALSAAKGKELNDNINTIKNNLVINSPNLVIEPGVDVTIDYNDASSTYQQYQSLLYTPWITVYETTNNIRYFRLRVGYIQNSSYAKPWSNIAIGINGGDTWSYRVGFSNDDTSKGSNYYLYEKIIRIDTNQTISDRLVFIWEHETCGCTIKYIEMCELKSFM